MKEHRKTNTVSFKTKKPIVLDVQVKSFGTHKNIPLSKADAFRVLSSEATDITITDDETGIEEPLTFENLDTVHPAINNYTYEDPEKEDHDHWFIDKPDDGGEPEEPDPGPITPPDEGGGGDDKPTDPEEPPKEPEEPETPVDIGDTPVIGLDGLTLKDIPAVGYGGVGLARIIV